MNIRDPFALGTLAGVIGTLPQILLSYISVITGYTKYHIFQLSAGIYMVSDLTFMPLGILIGAIVWEGMAVLLGIIIVFTIRKWGRDYWYLKGVTVSVSLMYIIIYGFLFSLGGSKIVPFDIKTNLIVLLTNILFGLTTAYVVVRSDSRERNKH